jgi:hypothetical protein
MRIAIVYCNVYRVTEPWELGDGPSVFAAIFPKYAMVFRPESNDGAF